MQKTSITVNNVSLYINPNTRNVKVGSKGKAVPANELFSSMTKGEARKLRKQLRNEGYGGVASVRVA